MKSQSHSCRQKTTHTIWLHDTLWEWWSVSSPSSLSFSCAVFLCCMTGVSMESMCSSQLCSSTGFPRMMPFSIDMITCGSDLWGEEVTASSGWFINTDAGVKVMLSPMLILFLVLYNAIHILIESLVNNTDHVMVMFLSWWCTRCTSRPYLYFQSML